MRKKKYSLVVKDNPHVAITLNEMEYRDLHHSTRKNCIDYEKKIGDVSTFLLDPRNVARYAGSAVADRCTLATPKTDPEYRITAVRDGEEYEIDTTNDDIFFCTTVAGEIARLFTRKEISWLSTREKKLFITEGVAVEQIAYLRGVYQFEIEHRIESHGFVLGITDEHVTVFNGYGGATRFYVAKFSREEWCTTFVYFFSKAKLQYQLDTYHVLWGFPRELVEPVVTPYIEDIANDDRPARLTSMYMTKIL